MTLLGPTLVLYFLVGLGVALALYLTDAPRSSAERWLRLATAVPFWPFYLPILLARPATADAVEDDWTRTLAATERELAAATATLEDWITISDEQRRCLDQLCEAWRAQAERLREMDRLLARPDYAASEEGTPLGAAPRVRQSLAARQQNLERLRQVRRDTEVDLLASLAWVRELASRIHLARFTDAPATQGAELLKELAAAVQMLVTPPSPQPPIHFIKKAE